MQELPFLHSARRLMLVDICMKFRQDSLRGFQVTERTRFVTDGQTDGRTDARGKTICLPTLKGGDITMLGRSPRCYILSFVKIDPPVLEKIFEGFLPYMGMAAILVM